MLSLLVRIFLAAVCGDGFTKLTVCDFFLASDLLGDRRRALCDEANMLLLFPLRRFDPAALAVGQQQVLPVCFQHEEVFALFSAGSCLNKIRNVHGALLRCRSRQNFGLAGGDEDRVLVVRTYNLHGPCHVLLLDNVDAQVNLDTGVAHRAEVLPVVGTAGRDRQVTTEQHVVGAATEVVDATVNAVEQTEVNTYVEGLLLLPGQIGVTVEVVGGSKLRAVPRYGVLIDISDEDVIVEFGSNKNCRIPMQKAAIAQVEKASAE